MPRRWKIFTIVSVLTLLADQLTKVWARHSLPTFSAHGRIYGKAVEVIPNFWDWRLSHNPGSAFGLFGSTEGARIFLSVVGILAVFAIFWMLKKAREDQTKLIWALGLVAGGAVGNLFDRIAFGVVTDFVVWRWYEKEWPTFNVADVALVIGVGLLFLDMSKEARAEARAGEAAGQGAGGQSKKTKKS